MGDKRVHRVLVPVRFVGFALIFVVGALIAAMWADGSHALLIGFDIAAALFLLSLIPLMRNADAVMIRAHALANDANRVLLLIITAILSLVILATIASVRRATFADGALIIITLALAWLFANMVFTLHYAHLYYLADARGKDRGGLQFPDTNTPDYWDFTYFSLTLGMTFQTSDVTVADPMWRRVVVSHGVVAFLFNIGVLAFTINALGSR